MKKPQLITNKEFGEFEVHGKKYLNMFGLKSWDVVFKFVKLEDDTLAQCSWDAGNRCATLVLNTICPLDTDIEKCALHEVLELLMSPLEDLAMSRNVLYADYDKEKHSVLRTFENIIGER